MSLFNRLLVFVGSLCLSLTCAAELSAKVDRSVIDNNETLQLVVRYDGQALTDEPDFSSLKTDFDIVSNNRQQQFSLINGNSRSFTEWQLVLMPKQTGKLIIPSFHYKGDVSDALEIEVRKGSNGPGANQPVFTETLLDKDSVYIQEQVLLTLRLYTSVRLNELTMTDFDVPDAIVKKVSENQYQKNLGGINYLVVEIKFAIFPQVSGQLQIPAQRFGAYESDARDLFGSLSLFNRGKQIIRATDSEAVNVAVRPAHIPANEWMPAAGVSLSQEWSRDPASLHVGEPITRTLTITAQGLTGAQLLPLTIPESNDYKLYPDQAQMDERMDGSGVVGVRKESVALVPNRSGEIRLPEVALNWWNTKLQRMETTRLAAQTIRVAPAENVVSSNPTSPSPSLSPSPASTTTEDSAQTVVVNNESPWWLRISLAFNGILLVVLAGVLLRAKSSRASKPIETNRNEALSDKALLKQVEQKASQKDYRGMRDAVLAWGRSRFATNPPTTLQQLANLLGDSNLADIFGQLDRNLYQATAASTFDANSLVNALKSASTTRQRKPDKRKQHLKPLYPTN